jgi:hypothetical protein
VRTSNVAYLTVTNPRSTLSFNEESTIAAGEENVAVADFNGDGKLDLATADGADDLLVVFLGNGDGTFRSQLTFPTGTQDPVYVSAGDFNADGFLDLAITAANTNDVSILLGNGDGTFQAPIVVPLKAQPLSALTADFNGDGKLDLAIANNGSTELAVLLGNGDGTFQSEIDTNCGGAGGFAVGGDFNGDGKIDVAVLNESGGGIDVLLGKGDGTFQPYQFYSGGSEPYSILAADINGDGILDLAMANENNDNGGSVTVLIGNGDGSFGDPKNYRTTGLAAQSITIGDFNGDGKTDIVASTADGSPLNIFSTEILFGNGDGTFEAPVGYPAGYSSGYLASDFNNDGALDIATSAVEIILQDSGTVITLSPTQLKFISQMVGTVSQPQVVQVTNNGGNSVTITSISATTNSGKTAKSNDFQDLSYCPSTLAAGASCTVDVFFTPEQQGNLSGYLAVFDTGGGSPQVVSLSGAGTVMQVAPRSLNFGTVTVGTSSKAMDVRVTNKGGTSVKITGITITGADAGDYAEVNACGATLGPGASCSIAVVFTPMAMGTRTAELNVADTGGGSPQRVGLTGTGQ